MNPTHPADISAPRSPVRETLRVLVIHGVGNPAPRELGAAVAQNLSRGALKGQRTILVSEFNWNQIVQPTLQQGVLQFAAFREIAVHLARASLICDHDVPVANRSLAERALLAAGHLFLMAAELGLALILWALFLLAPALVLLRVLTATRSGASLDLLRAVPPFLYVGAVTFAVALIGLLAAGALLALLCRRTAPLWIAFRRAVIVTVRPLLLSVLYPLLIPWGKVPARDSLTKALPIGLAWMTLLLLPLGYLFSPPGSSLLPGFVALLTAWGYIALVVLVVLGIGLAVARLVGPILKILLDVFRYVADKAYRDGLQRGLAGVVQACRKEGEISRFYLVAHSLGSVIALHSLVASPAWEASDRITLITLGSPIRRLFIRFFPTLFFPADVDEAASIIAGRIAQLTWINCYRPLDPIGTSLGFRLRHYTADFSTRQWRRLNAHPDYWRDDTVRTTVLSALSQIGSSSPPNAPAELYEVEPTLDSAGHRTRILAALRTAFIGLILLLPVAATAFTIADHVREGKLRRAQVARLRQAGIPATADVTHWVKKSVTMAGQNPIVTRETFLEFSFRTAEGREVVQTLSSAGIGFPEATYRMNVKSLARFVRKSCLDVDPEPLRRFGNLAEQRRCRRGGILLRYDPVQPAFFVPPGFPSTRGFFSEVRDWGFYVFSVLALTLTMVSTLLLLAGRWILLMLGLDLVEKTLPSEA